MRCRFGVPAAAVAMPGLKLSLPVNVSGALKSPVLMAESVMSKDADWPLPSVVGMAGLE